MAKPFDPNTAETVEFDFDFAPAKTTNEQLAFLVRRAARRDRRQFRALA